MDALSVALFALVYVVLQAVLLVRLAGIWRVATALPAPFLLLLLAFSMVGGAFGMTIAEIGGQVAVPVGIVYLLIVAALSQVAKFLPAAIR